MCRQVKERQVEDHLFGDKEKFVTAAYKKKLQEQQLWEAQQKIKYVGSAESVCHMFQFLRLLLGCIILTSR